MSFSKTLYPLLSTGSTQETSQHDRKFVDWDIKHQLKQTKLPRTVTIKDFVISDISFFIV